MIHPKVVSKLIELGKSPAIDSPSIVDVFSDLKQHDEINRIWGEWDTILSEFTTDDLVFLIKGLTIAELRFRWSGGSVASSIRVFSVITKRDGGIADSTYQWIIRRSVNPYVPTGRYRHYGVIDERMIATLDTMTESERENWYSSFFEKAKIAYLEWSRLKQERLSNAGEYALQRKQKRQEVHTEKKDKTAIRNEERLKLLALGQKTDEIGRLRLIVEKTEYPLDFFPLDWSKVSDVTLDQIDNILRDALYLRTYEKQKGPWKSLSVRLKSEE